MKIEIGEESIKKVIELFSSWVEEGLPEVEGDNKDLIMTGIVQAIKDLKVAEDGYVILTTPGSQMAIVALMETVEMVRRQEDPDGTETIH